MQKILSAESKTKINSHMHCHDYWELIYCAEGECRLDDENNNKHIFKKGEVIIIPPKLRHSIKAKNGTHNILLIIDNLDILGTEIIKLCDNQDKILYYIFLQCCQFYKCSLDNKLEMLLYLSQILISCIITFLDTDLFSPIVQKIKNEITKSFHDCDFNINSALKFKGNSAEYLRKVFKKETGLTPLQFLTSIRINHAKKLLKNKKAAGINISQIAVECGFKDSLYFSRLFKKNAGCPPNIYALNQE